MASILNFKMMVTSNQWQHLALLLIDVQQDFWSAEFEQAFPQFPDNIARLLKICRQVGIEVIHLREVFSPDGSDWLPRYRLRGRAPCVRGTPGAAVLSVAREQPGEMVIEKQTFDGFHHPQLLPYLKAQGKQKLLMAGLATSVCVLFTTASASQLGFLATLVSDCCADYPDTHQLVLKRYQGFVFDQVCLDEIPQYLDNL